MTFHALSESINRIGELGEGEYEPETLKNLEEGEKRIQESQQFTWILSDQILSSSIPTLMEKVKHPFDLRIILPDTMFPPENQSRLPLSIPSIQKRTLPKVDAIILITEKYAVFCPPNANGKKDYTGLGGTDPKFLKWCKDLFLYYWAQAKPTSSFQAPPKK